MITDETGKSQVTRQDSEGNAYNTLDRLREVSQREVNRRATQPSYSTSPQTNIMEQEYLCAWADVVEMLRWH